MALLYSAGELSNLLSRVPSGYVTCDPAAATEYPIAKASDDTPWPFVFGSLQADSYVQVRNNLIENPGFENALGDEWGDVSTLTGTVARTPVDAGRGGAGTYGLRCNGGAAGVGAARQVIRVRAGERLQLDGWIFTGVAHLGGIYLYNPTTGHYYDGAGGDWQAGAAYAASITGSVAYQQITTTYLTIESLADCLEPTMDLWLICRTGENADVDFDDVALRTAVNGIGAAGHNVRPCVAPTLRYSSDEFVGDDNEAGAIELAQPTFYRYLSSPIYGEWLRFKLGGTNTEPPSFDEIWLGYLETLSVGQQDGWSVTRLQITDAQGDLSLPYRTRRAKRRPRVIRLEFERWTETEWRELMDEIDRTFGGFGPIALVPSTTSNEARFVLGRLDPGELTLTRESPVIWKLSLTVHEMAFSMPLL
jgi:hypothetical protein